MGTLAGLGDCPLASGDNPGHCGWCGAILTGRRTRWCSDGHRDAFAVNHEWTAAREAARKRDGRRCVRCGSGLGIEVNHIEPRNGQGYGNGCWHHQDNLETLCKAHHREVTNAQRRARLVHPLDSPVILTP